MFKVNLEKELIRQNQMILTPKELLKVREFDKLGEVADSDALARVFNHTSANEGKQLVKLKAKKKDETLSFDQSRVFHISQIEKLCKKYYLKFLPTPYFKGSLDKETAAKIDQFEIANGIRITPWVKLDDTWDDDKYVGGSTYIVAPSSSFNLQKRPKDPLLFYQINSEYFYLIHKWGDDLSWFRRIKSFFATNGTVLFLLPFLPLFVIKIVDGKWSILRSKNEWRSQYEN